MGRDKEKGLRFKLAGNGIWMGLAMTMLIGTVLGMHDQINSLLVGAPQSDTTLVAEQLEVAVTQVNTGAPRPASAAPLASLPPLEGKAAELPPVEEEAVAPAPLSLSGISPDPVIGSDQPQVITILGDGMEARSEVAVSWSDQVKALDDSQIVVRDSGHMEITLTTGLEPAIWLVQVRTPTRQHSNILRFQVVAPKPPTISEETRLAVQPVREKAAAEKATLTTTAINSEPGKTGQQETVVEKTTSRAVEVVKGGNILGSSWVAGQPAGNYTLQLQASSERLALDEFVTNHPALKGPLASFEQMHGNKRLHVLIQGSYPDRVQADLAAKGLPDQLSFWIRDFDSIKKVTSVPLRPAAVAKTSSSRATKDTAWVWSQNPAHYTIQLAGAGDEAAIEVVMQGSSLSGEQAVVQTLRNGKPWYALIFGRFANKAAAQGAAARLPAAVKKAGPWIRPFSALQDEIGQAAAR